MTPQHLVPPARAPITVRSKGRHGPVAYRNRPPRAPKPAPAPLSKPAPVPAAPALARSARARWQRHHRRAALWLMAAFVGSQLALGAWVDGTPAVRDPEYAALRDRLRRRTAERPGEPVRVFLGSSRVAYGFDPAAAGDGSGVLFNFGVPGSGPYLADVLHERLSGEGVRPAAVFVEVLPAFYNAAGVRSLDHSLLDGARLSAREAAGLIDYLDRPTGPVRRWAAARALPVLRHQAELRESIGLDCARGGSAPEGPQREIGADGFRPRSCTPEQRAELLAVAHKQYDPFYADFRLAEKPYARLLRVVRRARADGAAVVLVAMPEGTEFRRRYTPATAAGVAALFDRLRAETGAPLVDARDWLVDDAFYDQHHLTPDGATAFGARFKRDVLPLAQR